MCGRYSFFTDEDIEEINEIIRDVSEHYSEDSFKPGEIFPTDTVPVLIDENNIVVPKPIQWGFPNPRDKGIVINARSDNLAEKTMFKKAFETGRCIVPSTGFYEWDKSKHKYLLNLPNEQMLYMAALYGDFDGKDRFVIVTTEANDSMIDIHDRMPLILTQYTMEDWIYSMESTEFILKEVPPKLEKVLV